MTQANWYNRERVSQPGSVVLSAWNAQRQHIKAEGDLGRTQDMSLQDLTNMISGFNTATGPAVTETTAMRVSAVYACVELVAGAISTLPLQTYKRTTFGRESTPHEYWWLLNEQPNPDMSAAVFWEYLVSARKFHGDGFAEIVRTNFGSNKVKEFRPHHPLRVHPFRATNRRIYYRVTDLDGTQRVVPSEDMIHIPSLGFDGLRSPSPITFAAKQAVATALSAAQFNGAFFTNGARPDFALVTPGKLNKEQAEVLRATWSEKHAGVSNAHLPAVLTGGLDIKQLTMSAEDSQILGTSLLQIEEICRVMGVPPHMVGHTSKTTSWGNGVEQMGRGFVKFTLRRDLVKIGQECNRKLWPTDENVFVDHDVSEIERGDLKTENDAYRVALGRAGEPGWMTPNEVRFAKKLAPIDGGDKLNDVSGSAPAAAKPDQPTETKEKPDDQAADTAGEES